MSYKRLILDLGLVFLLPSLAMMVLYILLIEGFGIEALPPLFEDLIIKCFELIVIFKVFNLTWEKIKQLNSKPIEIKKILLMIPLSFLARLPIVLVLIAISFTEFASFFDKLIGEGIDIQWKNLIEPTGFGALVDFFLLTLSLSILTPISEELLFRGILFNFLKEKLNLKISFWITVILFTLVHFHPGLFISSFILGIVLTLVYYRYKNIVYPIILHGLVNLLPIILGLFYPPML